MPKVVAMIITSLQLLQMVVGCAVNYFAFKFKESGEFLLVYSKMHLSQDFNRFTFCMPKIPIPRPPFHTITKDVSIQIYKLYDVQEDHVQSVTTISSTVPSCISVTLSSLPGEDN